MLASVGEGHDKALEISTRQVISEDIVISRYSHGVEVKVVPNLGSQESSKAEIDHSFLGVSACEGKPSHLAVDAADQLLPCEVFRHDRWEKLEGHVVGHGFEFGDVEESFLLVSPFFLEVEDFVSGKEHST